MMEGMIYHRVTPLLKCMVLFLFIFTAKVLTSRPHESQDSRNSIQHQKPSHYVRTFTKYHHRRTIQWNSVEPSSDWATTQDQPKVVGKRSIETPYEYLGSASENVNQLETESIKSVIDTLDTLVNKTGDIEVDDSGNKLKKMKVKAAIIVTDAPITLGPTISCLYKLQSVSLSVTPSYRDKKDEFVVENEIFDAGVVSEETLPSGEVALVEKCSDPKAFCYTLWHQDSDGNNTVLGQGCWRSSQGDQDTCDKCITVTELLPGSKFCCCTENYCNANFTSIREEVTIKAESTMKSSTNSNYSSIVASGILALVAVLLMAIVFRKVYCKRRELDKDDLSNGLDVEKGDVMGTGPDALATGLTCVDNLTLIEHIGQGKFGSVWRGSLGNTAVAVKLYSNPSAWHKEASVYAIPHLAHPNILRFYGSDVRAAGGGGRRLVVVELCAEPLRARLVRAPLTWPHFAALAHGLAAALAHLHAHTATKPCIVHRDVNSGNVLIGVDGAARLADLGLAQPLYPRRERAAPDRITEAGTLRYLSPEALEGALDLSGARAALCAVDVFALALVLWEMLWRCEGAHPTPTPPYAPPYAHLGLPARPTLAQMQNLVSRNKARPPLPRGPVPEQRALRLAADTCDECWDHDAEARLTAVCVEERMAELKAMLQASGPLTHDNLHPHAPADAYPPPEAVKNSNCRAPNGDITTHLYSETRRALNGDASTPLYTDSRQVPNGDATPPLYPDPHIGRNVCIQRNTNNPLLDHKDKELRALDCLSVARALPREPDRLNEIRPHPRPRPLDYVPNDVTAPDDRAPKCTDLRDRDKRRWGIRRFLERKLGRAPKETEVKLIEENSGAAPRGRTRTSLVAAPRPADLALEPGTLSPPNRTLSPAMMELGADRRPPDDRVFAVIVPRARPDGSSDSLKRSAASSSRAASESEDSAVKRTSDPRLAGSGRSSRASVDLELQYIGDGASDPSSDCSSGEDEHLLLLADGGAEITMRAVPRRPRADVLREASPPRAAGFGRPNRYANFDNEFSDPNDKENAGGYGGDNPVYLAALAGEIDAGDPKMPAGESPPPPPPKPALRALAVERQRSLEQVSGIFASSGDVTLLNPAGRVKTPGDLPVAVRRARRDRALQKGRAGECNRLSLYDDRMMFGNSL
ncbi:uncharacterized protein LOC121739638 [Aricia agestis]|uniref:uncharacterized protein LOC121739638 n=1 Tax=Aricia agestis TaxID=91739 RepID=UPI001C20A99D|nr:uncharacterized protein LOC121739638 [Aricia agestis]